MTKNIILFAVCSILLITCSAVDAQPAKKIPRIGYFSLSAGPSEREEAFKRGLRELGWIDGQTVRIEYRWMAGKLDQLSNAEEEVVRLNVDLIFATTARVIRAAKEATNKIPIVMPAASDPVGDGFIASLARPGGNITGMSAMILELEGKRLELLREIIPSIARVSFLNYGTDLTLRGVPRRRRMPAGEWGSGFNFC
jgi:putative tryptophan/tyrosine transport system substrate-binding protein